MFEHWDLYVEVMDAELAEISRMSEPEAKAWLYRNGYSQERLEAFDKRFKQTIDDTLARLKRNKQ